jgi:hypothetical protein
MNQNPTITKTVIYNGIEIRRSDELTASRAYLHKKPKQWVVDFVGGKWGFKTLQAAQEWINAETRRQELMAYTDYKTFWIIRPVDGKFTEVTISKIDYFKIKGGQ